MIRKYIGVAFIFVFSWILFSSSISFAQDREVLDLAAPIWAAITMGNYALAAAAAVILVGAMLSKYGTRISPWFGRSTGRASIVLVSAFGTSLFASLHAGAHLSVAVLWSALNLAIHAAGIYSLAKALVLDPLQAWKSAPRAVRLITSALAWIYNRVAPQETVSSRAETVSDRAMS